MSIFNTKSKKSHSCWNFTICWLLTHKNGVCPWTWWVGYENGVNITLIVLGIKGGSRSSIIEVLMKKFEKAINFKKVNYLNNRLLQSAWQVRR